MTAAYNVSNIYQFKITLMEISPEIWRQIQVPEHFNFRRLHLAIQCAMGWQSVEMDYHMHKFEVRHLKTSRHHSISTPYPGEKVIDENQAKIAEYFSMKNQGGCYEYDYGDGWDHEVLLEGIFPAEANTSYPKCLAGKRACPPEDCGGTNGYYWLLEALGDPNHVDRKEKIEWLDAVGYPDYKPELFDPSAVSFDIFSQVNDESDEDE